MAKITLFIFTCDAFQDLWIHNLTLLSQNFPLEHIEAIYMVSDKKPTFEIQSPIPVQFIWPEDGNDYLQKLQVCCDHCKTERFLYTLDDYFYTEPISAESLARHIAFAEERSADYLKLSFMSRRYTGKKTKASWGGKYAWLRTEIPYAIDLYPAIWRKDFVLRTINEWDMPERTVWDYEGKLSRLRDCIDFSNCYVNTSGDFPFLDVVRKGKVLHKAHKTMLRRYGVDLAVKRPVMSAWATRIDGFKFFLSAWCPRWVKNAVKKRGRKKGKHYYS